MQFLINTARVLLPAMLLVAFVDAPQAFGDDMQVAPASSGPSKSLLLYGAYFVMWLGLGGYVAYLHFTQRKVQADLEWLRETLDRKEP